MRVLVTGADGFVGRYLIAELAARGYDAFPAGGPHATEMLPLDLRDLDTLHAAFDLAKPDAVVHLAAQTFVPASLQAPIETYDVNVLGTARLLQALRDWSQGNGVRPRLLFVSSAEVYGRQPPQAFPLDESAALHPANPYAASKAAAEAIVFAEAAAWNLDAVVARAFNHIGPGQDERFVVAGFAAQLKRVERGEAHAMMVGNLQSQRDFLDVRDVVRAYALLLERGERASAYNVCSGVARKIEEILRELLIVARVPVEIREDPARRRPSDVPVFYGSNRRLREATGWEPSIGLRESLRDIYRNME